MNSQLDLLDDPETKNTPEPPTVSPAPWLISAEDLASRLSISQRTLWRLLERGQLPHPLRLGGSVRWRADELRQWIEAGCPAANQDNLPPNIQNESPSASLSPLPSPGDSSADE